MLWRVCATYIHMYVFILFYFQWTDLGSLLPNFFFALSAFAVVLPSPL